MSMRPRVHEVLLSPLTVPNGCVLTRVQEVWGEGFREVSLTQFILEAAFRGKRHLQLDRGE